MNKKTSLLYRAFGVLISLCLLLAAGCGGGGSVDSSVTLSRLTVNTDWSQHSQPTGGQSQVIQLVDSNGNVKSTLTSDFSSSNQTTSPLPAVPGGTYILRIRTYSLPQGNGTLLGMVDQLIDMRVNQAISTSVGGTAVSLNVTPPAASITTTTSQQFYASATDGSGHIVFLPPSAVTWSSLGGVATVSSDGVALGATPGSGAVRATYSALSLQAAATLSVAQSQVTQSKWTVLVYMNAANDLDSFSDPNFFQMQKVAQNPDVRFVVQWKQAYLPSYSPNPSFVGTRRYLVSPSSSSQISSALLQDLGVNVDMGSPATLNDFLTWGKTNFPSDRLCVVIWNHGNGWRSRQTKGEIRRGVSYDDDFGSHIDIWDLDSALNIGKKIDVLAWDASLMQMGEIGYEMRNRVSYMVGSEQSPPGAGYPYDTVFQVFRDHPNDTTPNLCKAFVDGMIARYTVNGTHITQSVVDLGQMSNLASACDTLSQAMIANSAAITTLVPTVRNAAQAYPPGDLTRIYRDLGDVCTRLISGEAPVAVAAPAQAVKNVLASMVIYERHGNDSAGSTGLAIDFSSASKIASTSSDYSKMAWSVDTHWDDWLFVAP